MCVPKRHDKGKKGKRPRSKKDKVAKGGDQKTSRARELSSLACVKKKRSSIPMGGELEKTVERRDGAGNGGVNCRRDRDKAQEKEGTSKGTETKRKNKENKKTRYVLSASGSFK